jgi:hypothetical protein
MTTTGDLIRGARGAAALVIDKQDDGLHVVTVRGAAVWPDADYQPCEQPPMGLLRQATAKAETLTRTRDEALAKLTKQREQNEARRKKINDQAVEAANSHGLTSSVNQLLRKFGMEGTPQYLTAMVQVRYRAEGASGGLSNDMTYRAPWAYSNNDVLLSGTWSNNVQVPYLPGSQSKQLVLPADQDLKRDCPCEEIRAGATPDWALRHFHQNVFSASRAWTVTVEGIGLIWVVDRNDSSRRCRHFPAANLISKFQEHVPATPSETKPKPRKEVT